MSTDEVRVRLAPLEHTPPTHVNLFLQAENIFFVLWRHETKMEVTMLKDRVQKDHHHAKRWHVLRFQPDLNLKIKTLNLTPSDVKNPPNFMTLINHDVPESVPQNSIIQSLHRTFARGDKLLTSQDEENLDMMFTRLLIHEEWSEESYR